MTPLVRETILAGDGFVPQGGHVRASGGAVAAGLVSPLAGAAAGVRQGHKQRDEAIAHSQRSTGNAAARFPRTAVYLVATPTRLVITDVNHATGRPSRIAREYDLDEVVSLTAAKGSFMHRMSKLQFTDGSAVMLKSPRGGGYYPQDSLPGFAAAFEKNTAASPSRPL